MSGYPKFLYCQNELQDSDAYVLHTEIPRFLARRIYHPEHYMFDICWVDRPSYNEGFLAELMKELKQWYADYQDHLAKPIGTFI